MTSTLDIALLVMIAIMTSAGVYLLLDRSLTRMLLGLLLVSNAINLLILVLAGPAGSPPILGTEENQHEGMADPLAQAMVLTAIVLTLGIAAFILALGYRSFQIHTDDDVDDDPEDTAVLTRTVADAPDRDRSDDPLTGAATAAGDQFDAQGNPLTDDELSYPGVDWVPPDASEPSGREEK